jgi:hypothetical protein
VRSKTFLPLSLLLASVLLLGHTDADAAVSKKKKKSADTIKSSQSQAAPADPAVQAQSVVAETPVAEKKEERAYKLGMSLGHFFSYRTDISPVTSITANAAYKINDRDNLALVWNLNKFYNIAVTEDEVALDDPTFAYSHVLHPDFWGLKWGMKLGATIPVSKVSQRNGITSRPSIGLGISRQFFDKKLTLAYNLGFQYTILQYTTTIDGMPLNQSSLSNVFAAKYDVSDAWSLNLSILWAQNFLAASPNQTGEVYNNGKYGFDGNISYKVATYMNARVGMSQNDQFMKNGRYEINVYDPMTVRYYLAVDLVY